MKKVLCVIFALMLLTGCQQPKTFETMSDTYIQPEPPAAQKVLLQLPEDAAKAVLEAADAGTLYLCDGYTVALQTLPAGNLDATLRQVTGYGAEKLQLWERKEGEISRIVCVWASAGEGGDQMGKAMILDDGSYHYALYTLGDANRKGEYGEVWDILFASLTID